MKIKSGGVYVEPLASYAKVNGAYVAVTPKGKLNGVYGSDVDAGFQGTMFLTGSDIYNAQTSTIVANGLRGFVLGHSEVTEPTDAATLAAAGFNHVRIPCRNWGDYNGFVEDGEDVNAPEWGYMRQDYVEDVLDVLVAQFYAQGFYINLFQDSDCGQGKLGVTTCTLSGNTNRNFFKTDADSLVKRAQFIARWVFLANRYKGRIGFYEIFSEPHALQDDGVTAVTQTANNALMIECMDAILAVHPDAIFSLGAINTYDIDLSSSIITANLSTWMAAHPNKMIITGNMLNGVAGQSTMYSKMIKLRNAAVTAGIPWYVNQLGTRTATDSGDLLLIAATNAVNSNKGNFACWEIRGPDVNEYPVYYGSPGSWTENTTRKNNLFGLASRAFTALETSAVAAATGAAGTVFIYIKDDLSNCYVDIAGTTLCTQAGDRVGRINAVVGGTNMAAAADDTTRGILRRAPGGKGWYVEFDGTSTRYAHSTVFYASADTNQQMIVAGYVSDSAANRIAAQCGTSGTNVRYPYLAVLAADTPHASWRGDDTVLCQVNAANTVADKALVLSAIKASNAKDLWVDGVTDGTQDTTALGTVASLTRLWIGATTTGAQFWAGYQCLWCFSKTLTNAADQRTVERFGAWIAGGGYKS